MKPERRFNVLQAALFGSAVGLTAGLTAMTLGGWRWTVALFIISGIGLALLAMFDREYD